MSSTSAISARGPSVSSVSGRLSPAVSSLQGGVTERTVAVSGNQLKKMERVTAADFASETASNNPIIKPTILTNLSDKLEPAFNKVVAILNFIKALVLGAGGAKFFLENYNAGFKDITEKYNKERKKIQEEFFRELNKLGVREGDKSLTVERLSNIRKTLEAVLTADGSDSLDLSDTRHKINAINKILGNDTGSKETSGNAVVDRGLLGKFERIEADEREEIEKLKLRIVETAKLVTGQEFQFEDILKPESSVSGSIPLPESSTFEKIMVDSKLLEKKVETNLILNDEDSRFEAAFTASFEAMGSAGILKYNAQKLDFLETRFKFSGANASEKANIVNALIDEYNKGIEEINKLQQKIEKASAVAKGVLNSQAAALTNRTEALGSRINPLRGNESESVRTESSSSQVLPNTRERSMSSSSINIDSDDDHSKARYAQLADQDRMTVPTPSSFSEVGSESPHDRMQGFARAIAKLDSDRVTVMRVAYKTR